VAGERLHHGGSRAPAAETGSAEGIHRVLSPCSVGRGRHLSRS
jgi:hypothetical protein